MLMLQMECLALRDTLEMPADKDGAESLSLQFCHADQARTHSKPGLQNCISGPVRLCIRTAFGLAKDALGISVTELRHNACCIVC